jgi:DNA-binding MarR family transcriptional regulator
VSTSTPAAAPATAPAPAGRRTGRTPETVQWLTAEQQVLWRAYREGTQRLADVLAHELEAQSGLSTHEYEVLVRLSEAPDRTLRMAQLADNLAHSRSRLTHTIRRMEEAGLVVRRACSDDARGVNCTMTDHGWEVLVAAAPGHVQSVRDHLVDVLTPEQFRALGEAMDAVRAHLTGGPCHVE